MEGQSGIEVIIQRLKLKTWNQIQTLALISCVTMRKSFHISMLSSFTGKMWELDNLFSFVHVHLKNFIYSYHEKNQGYVKVTANVPHPQFIAHNSHCSGVTTVNSLHAFIHMYEIKTYILQNKLFYYINNYVIAFLFLIMSHELHFMSPDKSTSSFQILHSILYAMVYITSCLFGNLGVFIFVA